MSTEQPEPLRCVRCNTVTTEASAWWIGMTLAQYRHYRPETSRELHPAARDQWGVVDFTPPGDPWLVTCSDACDAALFPDEYPHTS